MSVTRSQLAEDYAKALCQFFDGGGETALMRAYEIGRLLVESDLGVLDAAAIHQEALVGLLLQKLAPDVHTRIARKAAEFFAEAMGAFEMTRRGEQEANELLRDLNLTLKQQVGERTRALQQTLADLQSTQAQVDEHVRVERMKDEFLAMVSHELRTPLTSIRGSLSMLTGGVFGPLTEEVREAVVIAERNALRLIALVNDILDWEKLEKGRMDLHLSAQPLQPLIDRAAETTQAAAAQLRVSLKLPVTTASVMADGERLVMVLVNLLSNAVKYSPPDETVIMQVTQADDQVEVTVTDHGQGIAEEHQQSIFNRFWQVKPSTTGRHAGSGLGLAISKAIIEQHQGTIGVKSVLGKGSTFWVRIPAAAPAGRGP